jgi:hypothetical protein
VKQPEPRPVVLLSAGSEVITVSLVEELREAGAPIALVSFGRPSLFADTPYLAAHVEIPWEPDSARVAEALLAFTRPLARSSQGRLVVFATDDAVLRLLMDHRLLLEETLYVPRANALAMGGLDKAEFFEFLARRGLGELGAPTLVLKSPAELEQALRELGPEIVVKPALKPYRSDLALDVTGRKLLASWEYASVEAFAAALSSQWGFSERWIAQPRLATPAGGEAVVWVVRVASGEIRLLSAVAGWKHPPVGGTGCWVQTRPNAMLEEVSRRLADAIELNGLAEFEFLSDESGTFRVLECNARPWLQVALARASGLPVAAITWRALSGGEPMPLPPSPSPRARSWVMVERLLLSVATGAAGPRSEALRRVLGLVRDADYVAIYGTSLRGIRRAWVGRMLRALARRGLRYAQSPARGEA